MRHVHASFRYLWALPATAIGVLFAGLAMCGGATLRPIGGAFEVAGGRLLHGILTLPPSVRFVAITFGHIIIGVDHACLSSARAHEHVHVQQYERWGILFFSIYLASSIIQLIRGRHIYSDNVFEREAYAKARCELGPNPMVNRTRRHTT